MSLQILERISQLAICAELALLELTVVLSFKTRPYTQVLAVGCLSIRSCHFFFRLCSQATHFALL